MKPFSDTVFYFFCSHRFKFSKYVTKMVTMDITDKLWKNRVFKLKLRWRETFFFNDTGQSGTHKYKYIEINIYNNIYNNIHKYKSML